MGLYTKTGDNGSTGLIGGKRLAKSDPRIHAYGTIDELSALLGVILTEKVNEEMKSMLVGIQNDLYKVGSDLAAPAEYKGTEIRTEDSHVVALEKWIDELESRSDPISYFILPGGTRVSALLHHTRTVCRRAERWIVHLSESEDVNPECVRYVNRLSDALFAMARFANKEGGFRDQRAE